MLQLPLPKQKITYSKKGNAGQAVVPGIVPKTTTKKSTKANPFPNLPPPSPLTGAAASQQVPAALPPPTLKTSFLGKELLPELRDIRAQEAINWKKYPRIAGELHKTGWLPLITAAFEDEKTADSTLSKQHAWYQWVLLCDQVLAGTHHLTLVAYMNGNPTQMALHDNDLRTAVDGYHTRSAQHASIYVRHLTVGTDLDNLTVQQASRLATVARQYAYRDPDKWQEASRIDKELYGGQYWRSAWSKDGHRALITTNNNRVSSHKQRALVTWADALERLARDSKEPRIRPLYYVGYALDAHSRQKDHEKNDHSCNFLIRFVKAVLDTASWFNEHPVKVATKAICMLADEDVASVAEALVARSVNSYHFQAGFNVQPCGASVANVHGKDWTASKKEAYWVGARKWLKTHTSYDQYIKTEIAFREARQQEERRQLLQPALDERAALDARQAALRTARDELYEELDWDTLRKHDFFAEYIDMFENLNKMVEVEDAQA